MKMANEKTPAQKRLKSRLTQFKKFNKDAEKKEKFFDDIPGFEITVRMEFILPSTDPKKYIDGLVFYLDGAGQISNVEYYYKEGSQVTVANLNEKESEIVIELFQDELDLEIDEE